jgi:hypothetical protein
LYGLGILDLSILPVDGMVPLIEDCVLRGFDVGEGGDARRASVRVPVDTSDEDGGAILVRGDILGRGARDVGR